MTNTTNNTDHLTVHVRQPPADADPEPCRQRHMIGAVLRVRYAPQPLLALAHAGQPPAGQQPQGGALGVPAPARTVRPTVQHVVDVQPLIVECGGDAWRHTRPAVLVYQVLVHGAQSELVAQRAGLVRLAGGQDGFRRRCVENLVRLAVVQLWSGGIYRK